MFILFEQQFEGQPDRKCDRVNGGRRSFSSSCESEGTVFDLRWDIWSWNSPDIIPIQRRRDSPTPLQSISRIFYELLSQQTGQSKNALHFSLRARPHWHRVYTQKYLSLEAEAPHMQGLKTKKQTGYPTFAFLFPLLQLRTEGTRAIVICRKMKAQRRKAPLQVLASW